MATHPEGAEDEALEPTTIKYVGSEYYPPLEWLDEEKNPQGFIADVQHAMANLTGDSIETQLLPWDEALSKVLNGQADAVALIPSDERSHDFDFTQPFHYVSHGIFIHKNGKEFNSLSDMEGHKVAAVKGAFALDNLKRFDYDFEIVIVESELECLELVAIRKVDACVEVIVTSRALADSHHLKVKLSGTPFWPQPYALGVKKGNTELLRRLKSQLAQIVIDGTYREVYEKWQDELEWRPQKFWDSFKHLSWLIAGFLALILVAFLWNRVLRVTVAKKTKQLNDELQNSLTLQEVISFNANHDSVSNLLNRQAFFEFVDKEITDNQGLSKRLVIIAIRIINVDSIVTAFGYETAQDMVLEFSNKLREYQEATCAHFGNGIFAVSIKGKKKALSLIEDLREHLTSTENVVDPNTIFGLSVYDCSVNPMLPKASELVRRAMTALVHAHKKRVAVYEYDASVEPDSRNLKLLDEFHKNGCKDFVLHYQPQLDLEKNLVTHAEALIRWNHPVYGLVPPYQFIPLLEESGDINQVTRWVIKQAIAFIRDNPEQTSGINISVNITTRDLVDPYFLSFVTETVANFDARQLTFEVTESGLIEEIEQARQAMFELESLGITFAVDDFGTGYSSLSYLNEFSVKEVKLDRSFVSKICSNERALKIVNSTISLAHELNLDVVAEGVEDRDTLELLKQLGCDRAQGYLLARPAPQENAIQTLGRNLEELLSIK